MRFLVVALGAFLVALLLSDAAARATPLYAVRAGHSCRTCHIEPSGWQNPSFFERDCTMSSARWDMRVRCPGDSESIDSSSYSVSCILYGARSSTQVASGIDGSWPPNGGRSMAHSK